MRQCIHGSAAASGSFSSWMELGQDRTLNICSRHCAHALAHFFARLRCALALSPRTSAHLSIIICAISRVSARCLISPSSDSSKRLLTLCLQHVCRARLAAFRARPARLARHAVVLRISFHARLTRAAKHAWRCLSPYARARFTFMARARAVRGGRMARQPLYGLTLESGSIAHCAIARAWLMCAWDGWMDMSFHYRCSRASRVASGWMGYHAHAHWHGSARCARWRRRGVRAALRISRRGGLWRAPPGSARNTSRDALAARARAYALLAHARARARRRRISIKSSISSMARLSRFLRPSVQARHGAWTLASAPARALGARARFLAR